MNNPRLLAIGLALGAAGVGVFLVNSLRSPQQAPQVQQVVMDEASVLVASKEIKLGERVTASNMTWQNWPKSGTDGMITKSGSPSAMQDMMNSVAKKTMDKGDPIRNKNVVKSDQGGVMAAILPAGMRAITLTIESAASDSGLILPNDHVDVILSSNNRSKTLLQNIRVLAIGDQFEVNKGEKVMTGRKTASLELKPAQVEMLTTAKRKGTIWLSLRSLQDVNKGAAEIEEQEITRNTVTVTRFGRVEVMDSLED